MAVAGYLRLVLKPPTTWTSIGHGGGGKVRGALLKAAGMQRGWPDLIIAHRIEALGFTLVLGIELKAKRGSQSPEQKAVEAAFTTLHWDYEVCRSLEDVQLALVHTGIPMHIPRAA